MQKNEAKEKFWFSIVETQSSAGKFNMAEKLDAEKKLVSLPLARIKTIMKSSPDITNAGQESIFMVAKATVSKSLICSKIY